MTDKALSTLRRRMIEDMTIRNFAADTQRNYLRAVKNLAFPRPITRHRHGRRSAAVPAALDRDSRPPTDHQQHGLRTAVLLHRDARPCRCRQVAHLRGAAAEDSRHSQPRGGGALSGGRPWRQVQGRVQRCLWGWPARVGGGVAEGVRHRQRAHAAARRAAMSPPPPISVMNSRRLMCSSPDLRTMQIPAKIPHWEAVVRALQQGRRGRFAVPAASAERLVRLDCGRCAALPRTGASGQ
jgi:hypothetical protein